MKKRKRLLAGFRCADCGHTLKALPSDTSKKTEKLHCPQCGSTFLERTARPRSGQAVGAEIKIALEAFWRFVRKVSVERKLAALRELHRLRRNDRRGEEWSAQRARRRIIFDRIKNADRTLRLAGKRCLVCGEPAQCRHHLVGLANGGQVAGNNVSFLCDACHCEIHPHLAESAREYHAPVHQDDLEWPPKDLPF